MSKTANSVVSVGVGLLQKFRHAKFQKYINIMTIMTNVLSSKRINKALLKEKGQLTLFAIADIFRCFHNKLLPNLFDL